MTFMNSASLLAKRRSCFAAVAGLLLGALAGPAAEAQTFTLKFGTQTLNDIQHEYMKFYKTELEQRTNGRIKVELYPASQLGAINRMVEGIRLGTIEGLIGPAELYVGADSRYQALAMTGLFKDREHARRVLDNPEVRALVMSIGESRGLVTVGLNVYDAQMFDTRDPINKIADFAGKRIRVLASETEQASVRSLGAASVPMSLPEVLPAMQQGTIDGVTSVLGVFASLRYYDAAPYIVDTKLWSLIPVAQISKVWFDRLPPDLQLAVREAGAKIEPAVHKWQTEKIAADKATWAKNGGKMVTLSAADQAEAQKRVTAAIEPILAKDAGLKTFYEKLKALAAATN